MSDKPFKVFERWCAALISGTRYPANIGGSVDVESATHAGQCKLLKECSLEQVTRLTEQIDAEAKRRGKRGVLIIKVRRGRGNESTPLVVMAASAWKEAYGELVDAHDSR